MPSALLDTVHARQVSFAPAGVRIRQWPAQLASRGLTAPAGLAGRRDPYRLPSAPRPRYPVRPSS